jgi:NAD-dependent protein deacetylase/lipoamidase
MTTSSAYTFPPALIDTLRAAQHIAVLTGAGVSAESGLPTFRDKLTGLWEQYRPKDLSTPDAFRRDSRLVWEWFAQHRAAMAAVAPNPAHTALARMERAVPRLTLLTQNIDGLHQRAGSADVVELHGNIARTKCFQEDTLVDAWEETGAVPPRCPSCGGPLRPDVVWFGELLPEAALATANAAAKQCDVFFSIGTSGIVEPAASLAYRALSRGATVVVINLDVVEDASRQLYKINAPAGRVLPALVAATWPGETR